MAPYVPPKRDVYWVKVRRAAKALGSDGCTGVPDFYLDACLEHDVHWRTGHTVFGNRISLWAANRRFRQVIQSRSPLGRFDPLSWWRWAAVSLVAYWRLHRGHQ